MHRLSSFVAVGALVAFGGSGCGLISSDASVALDLPAQTFTVDSSGWQVGSAADVFLSTTCDPSTPSPNVCSSAVAQACATNCSGSCDATAHTCDLALDVAAYQTIDLLSDQPTLQSLADHTGVTVSIDSVYYQIVDNSLNIATPPLTLYVGPMAATHPSDAGAVAIATIDPVPAGVVVASTQLQFLANGQAALEAAIGDLQDPFNVIVGGTITLEAGDASPTGKLDASVQINAHATP